MSSVFAIQSLKARQLAAKGEASHPSVELYGGLLHVIEADCRSPLVGFRAC